MAKPLTAAAVAKYKPTGARRIIRDAGAQSLYLVIQPSGHKSWLMRFRRPSGKPGKLVLGPVDASGKEVTGAPVIGMPLTLVGARQLAAAVHRDRAMGLDPVADHKTRKHRQRAAVVEQAAGSYGALLCRFADEHAKVKTRRWRFTLKLLGLAYPKTGGAPVVTVGGLAERWANKPVRAIDGHDIHGAVDEARRVGVPGIPARNKGISEARARDLHAALGSMFGWLHRHRLVESNPTAGVWRPPNAPPRDRVLNDQELRAFWHACGKVDQATRGPRRYCAMLRLLLLTGCRLNEVGGMRRDELRADGTWQLPGTRTKNHRAHVVPLPPLAQECIASVPGTADLVFTTTGHTPPSGWSKIKRRLDAAMPAGTPPWRLHDLRRTAVTGMAELGIAPHVIELVVNHVSGSRGGIAGVYNRSELLPERRAALQRWAAHVHGLVSGGADKVIPLRK